MTIKELFSTCKEGCSLNEEATSFIQNFIDSVLKNPAKTKEEAIKDLQKKMKEDANDAVIESVEDKTPVMKASFAKDVPKEVRNLYLNVIENFLCDLFYAFPDEEGEEKEYDIDDLKKIVREHGQIML
jgi:hypothetical protein